MSSTESKLWHLERINLFKDLSPDDLEDIDRVASMKTMVKDAFIYFPEEPSKIIFLLKEGRVKLGTYSEDGKEIIKKILEPGEVFGELAIAGQEKRQDFAQVLDKNVRLCAINKDEMLKLLNNHPTLGLKVTTLIGERLQQVERKYENLIFKDAKGRIVEFLKTMALEKGRKVGYEYAIKHKLTHQDIANLTATSRQTVTIVLNELREQGIIGFDRTSFIIHEIDQLV